MRYAYQAYEVVIAFVGRIRRLRRLVVMLHVGGEYIAQPAQGFDQHRLVRVDLYFSPQPHD